MNLNENKVPTHTLQTESIDLEKKNRCQEICLVRKSNPLPWLRIFPVWFIKVKHISEIEKVEKKTLQSTKEEMKPKKYTDNAL